MNKKIFMFGIPLLCLALVSAGILTYYAQVEQTVNVEQAVIIDGIGCDSNICDTDATALFSPDTTVSGLYVLTNQDPEKDREISLESTSCGDTCAGLTTTYVKPVAKDDNTNFGSGDNEALRIDVDLTLDELFADGGLQYEYTILNGGVHDGAANAMVVINLDDGRHVVLYPGWGARSGLNTLQFSDAVSSDTGGNGYVDFTVYASDFQGGAQWSNGGSYPAWTDTKLLSGVPVDGTENVVSVSIMTQAADSGAEEQVESMLIGGISYEFIEGNNGETFTVNSGNAKLGFLIKNDFMTTPGTYVITTEAVPVVA